MTFREAALSYHSMNRQSYIHLVSLPLCARSSILNPAMAAQIICSCILITLLIVFRKQIREAFEDLNNRRGGPGTPMHPSPAVDDEILRHRTRL